MVGLGVMSAIVSDMHTPVLTRPNFTGRSKVGIAFRDTTLLKIFQMSITNLTMIVNNTTDLPYEDASQPSKYESKQY